MKVILSRKGFDSAAGGYASIITPDNKLVSLPIPLDDNTRYSDLRFDNKKNYYEVMKGLNTKIKRNGAWKELTEEDKCHLDPDLRRDVTDRIDGWKACFGQNEKEQTHLEGNGVGEGDLFLFFGWFRKTELDGDVLRFVKSDKGSHVIFGYLQIDKVHHIGEDTPLPRPWMKDHPHAGERLRKTVNNVIYESTDKLSWDDKFSGAGVFSYDKRLVLTKDSLSRSKWDLPECFKNVKITWQSSSPWKPEGYFQSSMRGQEFVIEDNEQVENWAKQIIKTVVLKEKV